MLNAAFIFLEKVQRQEEAVGRLGDIGNWHPFIMKKSLMDELIIP